MMVDKGDIIIEETFEAGQHGCIETLNTHFDGPFEKPIIFDKDTGELKVAQWAIRLYKLTKSGNVSKSGRGMIFVTFCPVCGERLIPEEE